MAKSLNRRTEQETWRRGLYRLVLLLGLATAASLLSVIMAFMIVTDRPEPRYFAAREDGGILPIVAVREPFLNDNQIINFATEAATRATTIKFSSHAQDLADTATYFTKPEGWEAFKANINESGMMDYIVTKRLISTSVPSGAVITRRGTDDRGVYFWIVQVRLMVTYQTPSTTETVKRLAEMEVVRVPTWEMSRGIGIRRINIQQTS